MQISKQKNPTRKDELVTGFIGGLNLFQDETAIKNGELTEAKNVLLNVDGIEPRPGTYNYGTESGDRVLGAFAYYKSDGTRELLRFADGANDKLQKYVAGVPTDIGTKTFDDSVPMNFVQANDRVYIFNGVDNLSYYDGTTVQTYTALTTPANLSVTPQGTTGSTTYSYRISAFNDVGETVACTSVQTTTGNKTINATNFNRLEWDDVAGAVGYNIYGRFATGLGETYIDTVYESTYDDNRTDENGNLLSQSLSILPPETNSTLGPIGSMPIFAISRIFISGLKDSPSRLIFSGTGEKVGNFTTPAFGAGGVDVFKNDGSGITAIIGFQGGVIVFKENAIYKFSFTSDGYQQLEEIVKGFGAIGFRSVRHVENDIIFASRKDGRLAFYSLGNQENYIATVLRTNELSIKIEPYLKDVALDCLDNSAGYYYQNLYICAIPKSGSTLNDRIWVLDTRFGAWVYWEGLSPNMFVAFLDDSGNEGLYYADETSGYLVEMFKDERNDSGVAIDVQWATKAFNQGQFNKEKRYHNPTFQFKDVSTSTNIKGYVYLDGVENSAEFTINQQSLSGGGVGAFVVGETLPGDAPSTSIDSGGSSDIPVEIYDILRGRSIKYVFSCNTLNSYFKFLSLVHTYSINSKRLDDRFRVYPT